MSDYDVMYEKLAIEQKPLMQIWLDTREATLQYKLETAAAYFHKKHGYYPAVAEVSLREYPDLDDDLWVAGMKVAALPDILPGNYHIGPVITEP